MRYYQDKRKNKILCHASSCKDQFLNDSQNLQLFVMAEDVIN